MQISEYDYSGRFAPLLSSHDERMAVQFRQHQLRHEHIERIAAKQCQRQLAITRRCAIEAAGRQRTERAFSSVEMTVGYQDSIRARGHMESYFGVLVGGRDTAR